MTKSRVYSQVNTSLIQVRRQQFYALFSLLLAALMLAGVWGTTAVSAAPAAINSGQEFSVYENSANGTEVGQVLPTGEGNYTITNGNDLGAFAIDPGTGMITVADGSQIDYEATPSFTLQIVSDSDPTGESVLINVVDLNDPPTVAPTHAFSALESLSINDVVGTISASDPDGNDLTYSILMWIGGSGPFSVDPDTGDVLVAGPLDYETPPTSFVFIVEVSDGGLDRTTTVTVDVTDANDPPVANDDIGYTVAEDNTLAGATPSVLSNDTDEDGDLLQAVLNTQPANGTVSLDATGVFTYTPNAQFNGVDTFTYYAFDGTVNSDVAATVTITVTGSNDAPTAVDDPDYTTNEETPLFVAVPGILSNDTDPENDSLDAFLDSGPSNGALTLNVDGSFIYTPTLDFAGVDTFTYHVLDDGDPALSSETATVTITVSNENDPPTVANETWSVDENSAFDTLVGTLNVTDPDGEISFSFDILSGNTGNAFSLNSSGELRVATSSALDFEVTPVFTLTVQAEDGGELTGQATVIVNLNNVNEAPTAVSDPDYTTPEDTPLSVDPPGVLGNDSDPEDDVLEAVLGIDVSSGALTLNSDGSFIYTPTLNFTGIVTFTYYANDSVLNSDNPATVTITVQPDNDAPVANDDPDYETDEEIFLSVSAPGVLTNDTDPEDDALTAVLDTDVLVGDLTLNPDGSFDYDPPLDFNGVVTFTYHANDGALDSNIATATITVNPVNDAPVVNDQSFDIDENSTANFGPVIASDIDNDVSQLSFGIIPGGSGDAAFDIDNSTGEILVTDSLLLNREATASFTLTIVVSDTEPLTDTATITINLNNVNEFEPKITDNQIFTITETAANSSPVGTVAATDDDYGEEPAAFAIIGGDTNGVFAIDNSGNLTIFDNSTLDFETTPVYTLTIQVTDNGTNPGTLNSTNEVIIHVTNVNDSPVIDSVVTNADTINESEAITVTINFSDQDSNDAHTVEIDWGDNTATQVDLEPGAGEAEESHTYSDDNPSGTSSDDYTITVTVTDDGSPVKSDSVMTSVTVNNVAPQLSNVSVIPTSGDEGDEITLSGDISDDSSEDTFTLYVDWGDGDTDTFNYAAGTTDFSETHTLADDGQPVTISLTLADDDTGQDIDSTTITVNNVAPDANAGNDRTENVGVAFNFAGSFTDPGANDTHTIEWDFGDTNSASGLTDPSHSYASIGVYTATLTVTDDDGDSDSDEVVVTVVSPSDLVATKTVRGDFDEGSVITYTITITNSGPSPQLDNTGDEFKDVLPSQLTLVNAQVLSGGGSVVATVATNTVTWNGGIASNGVVVLEIYATIKPDTKGQTVSNRAELYFDADGDGISNEATTYSDDPTVSGSYDFTEFEVTNEYFIFLPVILNNFTTAPDLVVTDINASSDLIEVVIENQGNAPVVDSFWVDFYIDPSSPPAAANDLWPELGEQGLAWGVTDGVAVGEVITLTYSTAPGAPNLYYVADQSRYYGSLPAGTAVYAQVDSAHAGIAYGAINELDELGYGPYNNILGGAASAAP